MEGWQALQESSWCCRRSCAVPMREIYTLTSGCNNVELMYGHVMNKVERYDCEFYAKMSHSLTGASPLGGVEPRAPERHRTSQKPPNHSGMPSNHIATHSHPQTHVSVAETQLPGEVVVFSERQRRMDPQSTNACL